MPVEWSGYLGAAIALNLKRDRFLNLSWREAVLYLVSHLSQSGWAMLMPISGDLGKRRWAIAATSLGHAPVALHTTCPDVMSVIV